jgi:hypothetical protein
VYGLEGLLAAVFHRVQFLGGSGGRIGIGYGWDPQTKASICLFPIRYDDPAARPTRFVAYPPDGWDGFDTRFQTEWPEPRPINYPAGQPPVTGGIVSLGLTDADTKALEACRASLADAEGRAVECWTSDPLRPVPGKLPADAAAIYAGSLAGPGAAFAANANLVNIMPRRPLEPGGRYTATVELRIAGQTVMVNWSFRARPRTAQPVAAGAPAGSAASWDFALASRQPGDLLALSAGTHRLPPTAFLEDAAVAGAGADRTRVVCEGGADSAAWLFCHAAPLVFAEGGARATVTDVAAVDCPGGVGRASDGATVDFSRSAFERVGSPQAPAFYAWKTDRAAAAGAITIGEGCRFQDLGAPVRDWIVPRPGREWRVLPGGPLALADALFLAPPGETILVSGSHRLSKTVPVTIPLSLRGEGPASIEDAAGASNYLFALSGKAAIDIRGVDLTGEGWRFYLGGASSLSLAEADCRSSNGATALAVLADQATARLENCDFTGWNGNWILALGGPDCRYAASGCRFAPGAKPTVSLGKAMKAFEQSR